MKRVVLAYSGSVATSVAIRSLLDQGFEVVTLTLDVGQQEDLAVLRERSLALGALRAHVLDAREELVREYGLKALQAGALVVPGQVMATALSRAVLASRVVAIAQMESAPTVAHAADPTAGASDAINTAIGSLAPDMEVVALRPAWALSPDEIAAATGARIPDAAPGALRTDGNLLGRVVSTDGELLPDTAFLLTRHASGTPPTPAFVEIEFAAGVPVRTNGLEMPFPELLESLDTIAGVHGVGRTMFGDARAIESPAAAVLQLAHRTLEAQVLGGDVVALKSELTRIYVDAVVNGRWFSDIRLAVDAFTGILQRRVNGSVRIRLHRGECAVEASAPAAPNATAVA